MFKLQPYSTLLRTAAFENCSKFVHLAVFDAALSAVGERAYHVLLIYPQLKCAYHML